MKKISIDGVQYPVKFGLSAIRAIQGIVGAKSVKELQKLDEIGVEKYPEIILAGVKNGCKITGDDPPSKQLIEDELDNSLQLYYDAMQIFVDDITPSDNPVAGKEGN